MRKIGPAWSLVGRKKPEKGSEVPGPGAYSSNLHPNSPSFSISRSNRQDFSKNVEHPGPGSYSNNAITTSKSVVFGAASRMIGQNTSLNLPGPGNYEIPSLMSEGPKYSLRGRCKVMEKTYSPGPGQYEVRKSTESALVHSFTRERRSLSSEKLGLHVPGPGQYHIKEEPSQGIKFGTDERVKTAASPVPGPGAYNLPSVIDSKGFSIYGKPKIKENERSPGPANYEFKQSMPNRSFSIGRSSRFRYRENLTPGPGAYSVAVTKKNSSSVFSQAKRESYLNKANLPGPGAYNIPEKVVEGPCFTIRTKNHVRPIDGTPGPGQYESKKSERGFSPIFGTSKRQNGFKEELPGPGQYSPVTKENVGVKFGSEAKLRYKKVEVPGPGAYDIPLF
jgi:hypothetical protein